MTRIRDNIKTRDDFNSNQKTLLISLFPSMSKLALLFQNPEFKRVGDALKINFDEIYLQKDSEIRKLIEENIDKEEFKDYLQEKGEEEGVYFFGKFVSINTIVSRLLKKGISKTVQAAKRKSNFKLGAKNGSIYILRDLICDYKIRQYISTSRDFENDEIRRVNNILDSEKKSKIIFKTLQISKKNEKKFMKFASRIATGESIDWTKISLCQLKLLV